MRTSIAIAGLLLCGALAPAAASQFQVLFTEDFEGSPSSWVPGQQSVNPPPTPLWHVAEPNECGTWTSRMLAYCFPAPSCTYTFGSGMTISTIQGPSFLPQGQEPYFLSFDGIWGFDLAGANAFSLYLEDAVTGQRLDFGVLQPEFKASPQSVITASIDFFLPSFWTPGHPLRVGLLGASFDPTSTGSGPHVDNIYLRSSAYEHFGVGVAGINPLTGNPRTPTLWGYGPLTSGSKGRLQFIELVPDSIAVLLFGLQTVDLPFKSGVLYPEPSHMWVIPTGDANPGHSSFLNIPFTLPALPGGLELYMQCWVQDASAAQGWAASSGLKGVTS